MVKYRKGNIVIVQKLLKIIALFFGLNPKELSDSISQFCYDCGMDTHDDANYYMVKNDLWNKHFNKKRGMLCIGCLEKRIGRKLKYEEFIDCELNNENYKVQEYV